MDGGYAELVGELEHCERRLAETRRRFVYSEGGTEFTYNEGRAETPRHAELPKLEAELRHVGDRLHQVADGLHHLRHSHWHEPVGRAGHS